MKKILNTAATAAAAAVVLALIAAGILLGDRALDTVQLETVKILAVICGCSIAYCFIAGEAARNFSQMDKLWSVLPVVYLWITAAKGGMKPRLVIFAVIVTLWGVRLTYNFARKGAYSIKFWSGEQDYRWAIVRESRFLRSNIAWALFDLFFISFYQNALVLAICLPAVACMSSSAPLGLWDAAAALFAAAFLSLETVADEYQWKFHKTKKQLQKTAQAGELSYPYSLGFNTTGPWAYMRHPNYLGEQGIWLSLYFFAAGAGVTRYGIFHPFITGPLALVLLFMGSSALGEKISSGKYAKYADYANTVFKYLPFKKYTSGE